MVGCAFSLWASSALLARKSFLFQTEKTMNAEIKGDKLVISISLNKEPRLSSSGKTMLVASETVKGALNHNGAPVTVAVNAYTPA
jgi:hypothetical protein